MHSPDLDYESILDDPEYSHLGPQTPPSPDAETRNASSHVSQRRQPSLSSTDYSDSPRNSQVALPRAGGTFTPPTAQPPSFAPPPPKPNTAGLTSRTSARSSTLSSTLEHNPNSVVKRKPLSSTASALAAARSSAASLYNRNTNTSQDPSPAHRQSVLSETSLYSSVSETLSDRSPTQNPAFVSAGPPYDPRGSATNPPTEPRPLMGLGLQHLTDDLPPPPPPPKDLPPQTNTQTAYDDYDDYNDDDSLYDSIYNNTNTTNANSYPAVVEQQPSPSILSPGGYDGAIETATAVKAITVTQVGKQNSKPVELDNNVQPKSPISPTLTKLGSLFSWGSPSPSKSEFSSVASPVSPRTATATDAAANPRANDTQANGNGNILTPREPTLQTPLSAYTQPSGDEIDEMEDELKAIGGELAASIRREMDLEDLVDRLQADLNNSQAPGKRTSDYYSDSGISSAKFSEFDHTKEEVEKIQRRAEQEKAQLRLELTTKLQDEREKRRDLDLQIKDLSEKAAQVDAAHMNGLDASGRLKTLEATCGDLRRRLSEEREVKNNFEDLLGVLRGELQMATNERDNLRDEIVPQLRARVEGLESQAADHTNLTYETTKMQQDLITLREENEALRKSREVAARVSMTLSRSNSLAGRPPPFKLQQAPATLARSNTTAGKPESKDALAERLKDVEAQRDALHSALKNLLDRQEYQNRENEKKIKYLEVERDRLLTDSPKKAGYEKDIANLRNEVSVLRRRAEDAMEQKWRVEEGLAHMKMDLDRAEEEIAMLRSLLGEKDILIPPIDSGRPSDMSSRAGSGPVSSASLEKAYRDLQASYTETLERIAQLESNGAVASNEKTQLAMKRLELTLSAALSERDAAREEAAACKSQLDSLLAGEAGNLTNESALASELRDSAERVEQLAAQVKTQLEANSELRQRLSDAVTRGEADRKSNVDRVTRLQNRLKTLEDQLVAAQTASEERVARHEAEITAMREAHNAQLHRLSGSAGAGSLRSPRLPGSGSARQSPLPSPLFPRTPRTPRFAPQKTIEDDAEVSRLRDRVAELERAVAESEREMQDVVAKMSEAQIEVMTLQEARDAAVRETRRVQAALEAEGMRGFEERFRTLGSA
ncbi:related to intracellular protein transport protein [Cephalotrichum gorgonifer]|uniref:Related to intracellular protein transport protein n=1 Tax=Cephalotrichum gorgonifer TaxID=2041049 RepID=A0AAE8MQY8_9PEZI|nr:related to intracellular protein transport protein [Cephalotrichum gorgonifer]